MFEFLKKDIKFYWQGFVEKHGAFVKTIYQVAFGFGWVFGIWSFIRAIMFTIVEDSFFGFILTLIFETFIVVGQALIATIVWGTIGVVVLFIPYLIIRGLIK